MLPLLFPLSPLLRRRKTILFFREPSASSPGLLSKAPTTEAKRPLSPAQNFSLLLSLIPLKDTPSEIRAAWTWSWCGLTLNFGNLYQKLPI